MARAGRRRPRAAGRHLDATAAADDSTIDSARQAFAGSIPELLEHFDLADNAENREAATQMIAELMEEQNPGVTLIHRQNLD